MQDLGTLPGFLYSFANGINNSGQVVGYSPWVVPTTVTLLVAPL
jgi:hypothetical protein